MLCPEVWNFKAPESVFKAEKGKLNQSYCTETINNFYYNHLVSIVLPDTLHVPNFISELFTVDCDYYKIPNCSVGELVTEEFIDNFIKKGSLTALSIDRRIDCDDCVSITPEGILVLSLKKETYQTLGLEGKLSQFNRNSKDRFIVKINLLLDYIKPDKRIYKRIKSALEKLTDFNFLMSWEPPDDKICPSSVAKYFYDSNHEVRRCVPQYRTRTEYSAKVPAFKIEMVNSEYAYDLTEWLGMLSVEGDVDGGVEGEYLSSYSVPEPNAQFGQVKFVEARGLFTVKRIERIFEALKKYKQSSSLPWVSLHVQGFSDSPVNWHLREHHYFTNGDNSYTIWLDSTDFLLCKLSCSFKYYKQ